MLWFGVRNLRRLKSIEPVQIRPITLLVGRNSSGKSSFLRSFPLVRQSLMTRTSSPILWYGDFVDLGSFKSAISDNTPGEAISFLFGLDAIAAFPRFPRYYPRQVQRAYALRPIISIRVARGDACHDMPHRHETT